MDTRHQSDRHEGGQQERPKDSKKRHRREHQRSSKDPEHLAHKEPLKAQSRPSGAPAQLPKESQEKMMSGHDDYVRRWLAQTGSNANQDPALVTRQNSSTNERDTAAHANFGLRLAAHNSEDAPGPAKGKRRHNSSSDSSLLEVPIRPQSQRLRRGEPGPLISQRPEDGPTPRKKQKTGSSAAGLSTHSAASGLPRETFERRPRYKTHADRYEPKKNEKKSKTTSEGKTTRKKRERRGDRRKSVKKAGEGLMQNFNSKSISQSRLTMRPSHGPGLFNNGRASSPARRRGLPDLAFSEMEFLQHSHKSAAVSKGDKVISKSREEREKATRAQAEISTFFRPNRMPLQEVSSNKCDPSLANTKNAQPIYTNQLEPEQCSESYDRSQSLDIPQERSRRFERPWPLSDQNQAPTNPSPAVSHRMRLPNSTSRRSGKAMTDVSWSESQTSPAVTSRRSNLDPIPASPTPDSVWRSIENTGIFEDTGIKIVPDSRRAQPSSNICKTQSLRDHVQRHGTQSERTYATTTVTTSSSAIGIGRSEITFQVGEEPPHAVPRPNPRDGLQEQPDRRPSRDQIETTDQPATSRKRIVVEHFDPQIGWHEDPSSTSRSGQTSAAAMRNEIPQELKSKPLSRDQIAKNARIKMPRRPSTTLPVVHFTESQRQLSDGQTTKPNLVTNADARDSLQDTLARTASNPAQGASVGRESDPYLLMLQYSAQEPSPSHVIENMLPEPQVESKFSSQQNSLPRLNTSFAKWRHSSASGFSLLSQEASFQEFEEKGYGDIQEGESKPYRGLPIRGSWLDDTHPIPANRSTRLSPIPEVEPLYMHQLQRNSPPSERTHHTHHINPNNTVIEGEWELLDAGTGLYVDEYLNQDHQYLDEPADSTEYVQDENHAAFQSHRGVENTYAGYDEEAYQINDDFGGQQLLEDQSQAIYVHHRNHQNTDMYGSQKLDEPRELMHNVDYYGVYDVQGHTLNAGFWQPRHQY